MTPYKKYKYILAYFINVFDEVKSAHGENICTYQTLEPRCEHIVVFSALLSSCTFPYSKHTDLPFKTKNTAPSSVRLVSWAPCSPAQRVSVWGKYCSMRLYAFQENGIMVPADIFYSQAENILSLGLWGLILV